MGLTGSYKTDGYSNSTYNTWDFEIIGGGGGGANVSLSEGGLTFNLNGEQRTPQSRFTPQTCTFEIIVENSSHQAFVDSIASYTEESFFLKASMNGAVKYIGKLTGDGNEQEDIKKPYNFKLQASDGMGVLSGRNFANDGDAPYLGDDTIINIIFKCLLKIQTTAIYGGEIFLITLHDNVEDNQTVDGDPFKTQKIDQSIFYDKGKGSNEYNYRTCEEVLKSIMVAYDLCLRYVGPHYLLYKLKTLAASGTGYKYDSGGGYLGTVSYGSAITINNDHVIDADRKGISSFGTLPPLEKVRITYDHGPQNTNMLLGVQYGGDNRAIASAIILDYGNIDVDTIPDPDISDTWITLKLTGKIRTSSTFSHQALPPRWKNHRYHFRLYLQADNSGVRTWNREIDQFDFYNTSFSNFTKSEFKVGSGMFEIYTAIIDARNRDVDILTNVEFDTTFLFYGLNAINFGFELVRIFDENDQEVLPLDNPILCEWSFQDLELYALEAKKILNTNTKTVYDAIGNVKNSDVLHDTTIIGDGPQKTSNSRIKVLSGGEYKDSKTWGGLHLLAKSAKDALASRSEALHLLLGGFYARSAWMDSLVTYNGRTYFAMSIQYISQYDEWTGEWFELKAAAGGITTKKKIILKKDRIPQVPTRLPDDERLEDRHLKIITSTLAYSPPDTGITSILLRDPARFSLWHKGDIINIIDPVIGETDELTLTQDVLLGDTSISIESWTPLKDFPPGSYLEENIQYEIANNYSETGEAYDRNESFTGTIWDIVNDSKYGNITPGSLPDQDIESEELISKRVKVYKSGVKLMYNLNIDAADQYDKGFTIDYANDQIIFTETIPAKTAVEVYIYKNKKQ